MKTTLAACAIVLAVLSLAGCSKAQARVVPEMPPLEVPAPPPRNVEATEKEPPPPPVAAEEPAPVASPARARPAPAAAQRPDPPKPEAGRETPGEPQKPTADAKAPGLGPLQTTPAGRQAQVERNIRDTLSRAVATLNKIDYRVLNADARTQYDQAKRFVSQAQDALSEKNLVFAANLADKANTLASQLGGR